MRRLAVLAALALSACDGVSENDFIVGYEVSYCEAYGRCASDEMLRRTNEQECLEWYRIQAYPEPPDCRYDAVAAESCLLELPDAGCTGIDPTFPASCGDVYSACRYPRLPRAGEAEDRD